MRPPSRAAASRVGEGPRRNSQTNMSTNKSGNNGNHGGGNQGVPGNGQQGGRNGGNLGTSHSTTQGGQHQGQHGQQAQQGGRGVAGKDAEVEDLASKDRQAADEQTQAPDTDEPRDADKGSRPPPAPGARRSER